MSDTGTTEIQKPLLNETRDREILDWVQKEFNKAKQNRLSFERQWYMNLAFYFGRQYTQWSPTTSQGVAQLYEPPVPPWRVRLVSNKVRPIVRTELAKVTKEKPQAFVVPSSTDDKDLAAARGAEALFDYLWRVLSINRMVRRSEFWAIICGTSFMKDWYDSEKVDANGKKGSICLEPVSPFHLYVPDTQEEELEHQAHVTHVLAKDPEWIRTNFNKEIRPDSGGGSSQLESRFLTAIGINSNVHKDYVAVHEMWVKPCKKFEKGAVIIWAGEQILSLVEEWPYQHGEYPFTKFDHIPTGRFYADSTIPDLIPLQKEYNRTRSQIIEAKNRMAKPQLIAPRGSVDPTKMTSEPGLIIFYTPGFTPPQPLPLQSIPSYVIEELDRCQRDMDDISSQHEVTKGRTPPGVSAATAISYLQEEDDSKLAATISSLEEGVEKIGRHSLSHVQQYWDVQRQIQVIGDDGQWEQFEFGRTDLRGNTDLKVESGSATPRSRAAKQAFIMELSDKQLIPPDRALKYLDMGETSRLYEELQLDSRQAQRENLKMREAPQADPFSAIKSLLSGGAQPATDPTNPVDPMQQPPSNAPQIGPDGQPIPVPPRVPVNDWDNHEIHIVEHNNYRKKQEFEQLPDEIKIEFQNHVAAHKMALQMAQTGMAAPVGAPMPGGNPVKQPPAMQQGGPQLPQGAQ